MNTDDVPPPIIVPGEPPVPRWKDAVTAAAIFGVPVLFFLVLLWFVV